MFRVASRNFYAGLLTPFLIRSRCQTTLFRLRVALFSLKPCRTAQRSYSFYVDEDLVLVTAKSVKRVAFSALKQSIQNYKRVHLDIGTGDGKFVYRQARNNPEDLYIGLDANDALMRRIVWQCERKPAKGGLANAFYIHSSLENFPKGIQDVADEITINYPWAKLLHDIVTPSFTALSNVVRLAKNEASLDILLNYHVFQEDKTYLDKKNLSPLNLDDFKSRIGRLYRKQGIQLKQCALTKQPKFDTTWGNKLTKGGGRIVFEIEGMIRKV